jgi:thioredoxin-related protein
VEEDMRLAQSLGIYSTPSMVVYRGDKIVQIIQGYVRYEKFARFLKP